jgi:hypothetical protein
MLSNLTPIEELSINCGVLSPHRANVLQELPSLKELRDRRIEQLEALRQAIILDMVSKLEPAGYMNDDDYCSLSEPLVEDENGEVIPLYDLSAFKDTPK